MSDITTEPANASSSSQPTSDASVLVPPRLGRRRRWARVLLASAFLAQGAALYLALARSPEVRVETRVEHTKTTEVLAIPMAPQLVHVPVAAPPTTAELRACPTPRTDAPRITPPVLPEDVERLAVSPTNAGWIAAWNDEHIFISTDAGRTFRRTLDGAGGVRDVDFDCFGRVFAIRGEALGISDAGRDSWSSVPGIRLADEQSSDGTSWPAKVALIGGGRDIILVGSSATSTSIASNAYARVAVTRDRGASWSYHDLRSEASTSEDIGGYQRADGTIVVGVEVPDCMSDALSWVVIQPDGTSRERWISMPGSQFELHGDQVVTAYARRSLSASDDAPWTHFPEEPYRGMPIQAPFPVFVTTQHAWRLDATKPYPWVIEGEHHAMDPAGRLWSIVCGQLWIAGKQPSGRSCTHPRSLE